MPFVCAQAVRSGAGALFIGRKLAQRPITEVTRSGARRVVLPERSNRPRLFSWIGEHGKSTGPQSSGRAAK
jgi:hypothetical protein